MVMSVIVLSMLHCSLGDLRYTGFGWYQGFCKDIQ